MSRKSQVSPAKGCRDPMLPPRKERSSQGIRNACERCKVPLGGAQRLAYFSSH